MPDRTTSEKPEAPARKAPNPLVADLIEGTFRDFAAPIPLERTVSVAFRDLAEPGKARNELDDALHRHRGLDLDLKVANNAQALDRLKAVLAEHGIKLAVDPSSAQALKGGQKRAAYWLYAENVRAEELTQALHKLAAAEAAQPFEKLTVTPLESYERRQVIALLGIDPSSTLGSTQGQLNDGGNSKRPRPVARERVAVVLPQTPAARTSEEVRQFLYQPSRPQPGTVSVLLKVHQD